MSDAFHYEGEAFPSGHQCSALIVTVNYIMSMLK